MRTRTTPPPAGARRPARNATAARGLPRTLAVALGLALVLGVAATPHAQEPEPLEVMLDAAPATLNPFQATDATGARISHQLIFGTLLRLGDDLGVQPNIVASWEQPAPERYRFTLKEGVRFHDGSPCTAADAVYTLRTFMDPETGSAYGAALREKVDAIERVDERTFEVRLNGAYPSFLGDLILPVVPQGWSEGAELNGAGPFRFVSREPNAVHLARHAGWHGGTPGVARVTLSVVNDENTRLLKLRKGDVDLAINVVPVDKLGMFTEGSLAEAYRVVEAPGLSYQYLGFNLQDEVLSDVRVRRAIAHAIDVQALIQHKLKGHARRATGLLPPGSPAAPELQPYAHDPERARALLEEAGYPVQGEARFELNYKTSTDRSAVLQARIIQQDLRKVGIALNVRSYEWGTFYEDIQNGNFQLYSLRWIGVYDPVFQYELFHSQSAPPEGRNRGRYANPEMDRLLEQARNETDAETRRQLYRRVGRLVHEDLPYLSLWHNNNVAVVARDLAGFRLHPAGGFEHLAAVRRAGE